MSSSASSLAVKAEGRVISWRLEITLTPPQDGELGDTDIAWAIGKGLLNETVHLFRTAAEREGFEVDIKHDQTVY